MDSIFYTYLWLREDGTPYYVGKGRRNRASAQHRVGSPPPKERILIEPHTSEADAFESEKFLIAYYGRLDIGTGCLRNLSDGGSGGTSGYIPTSAAIQKVRAKHLGSKRTAATRARMRVAQSGANNPNFGKQSSDKQKAAASAVGKSTRGKARTDDSYLKANHKKWHVNRGTSSITCKFCQ